MMEDSQSMLPMSSSVAMLRPASRTAHLHRIPPPPSPACSCGGDKFQDGAVTANNPSIIALQEARLLWPDHLVRARPGLPAGWPTAPPALRPLQR